MSIMTWMEEFYPIDAKRVPADQALAHSLAKWKGLRKENLKKHEVERSNYGHALKNKLTHADDPACVVLDSTSCALCIHYFHTQKDHGYANCRRCPLYAVSGKSCDSGEGEGKPSPWGRWINGSTREPMIELIEQAIIFISISINHDKTIPS